jgi:hypothetical protein
MFAVKTGAKMFCPYCYAVLNKNSLVGGVCWKCDSVLPMANTSPNKRKGGSKRKRKNKNGIVSASRPKCPARIE